MRRVGAKDWNQSAQASDRKEMSESMDFARVRSRLTALVALALVIGVVGGCAAPEDKEKARFGNVAGVVQDQQGNPIPGAQVTVIQSAGPNALGTSSNFAGDRGPFVTDANGRFFIDGVQTDPSQTVVLNLGVTKQGFVPTVARWTPSVDVPVAGAVIPKGAASPDIAVTSSNPVVTNVTATLVPIGASQTVSSAGATLTAPVPDPNAPANTLGNATLRIPAGALAQPETIGLTVVPPYALPG